MTMTVTAETEVAEEQLPVVDPEVVHSIRQAADNKAALVGLKPGEIQVETNTNWDDILKLIQSALKVKLHIGGTTFKKTLSPEDFGLTFESAEERAAFNRTIKLGDVYLMTEAKRAELATPKGKAQVVINKCSLPTEHFGDLVKLGDASEGKEKGWHFKSFLDQINKLGQQYMSVAQSVYDEWPELMAELRSDFTLIAIGTYARMKTAGVQGLGTLDEEVKAFVDRRMAEIEPRREAVRASFYWKLDVKDIPLASALAADQAEADKIKATAHESMFMAEIEQAKLETTRREVGDGIQTLFSDLKVVTNQMVYNHMVNVLKAIRDNGEIPGGSVAGLKNLVEKLQRIQILPDEQIDQQVAEIKSILVGSSVKGASINDNVYAVQRTMKQIAMQAKLVLGEFDRLPDESTREFGIPDTMAGLQKVVGFSRGDDNRSMDIPVATMAVTVSDNSEDRTF